MEEEDTAATEEATVEIEVAEEDAVVVAIDEMVEENGRFAI